MLGNLKEETISQLEEMIRVTFDSNVWEQAISTESDKPVQYRKLRQEIQERKIEPYICEIALTLDSSIPKKNRPAFWQSYQPKMKTNILSIYNNELSVELSIAPDNLKHPGIHPKLQPKLIEAKKLGFKALRMTNIGTVRCLEIPTDMLVPSDEMLQPNEEKEFHKYFERVSECSEFITNKGWGFAHYRNLQDRYKLMGVSVYDAPSKIPSEKHRAFSESIAEWVDGDALAAHFGYQNDCFCTEDRGRNAGSQSVFYPENKTEVENAFGLKILSVSELLAVL